MGSDKIVNEMKLPSWIHGLEQWLPNFVLLYFALKDQIFRPSLS